MKRGLILIIGLMCAACATTQAPTNNERTTGLFPPVTGETQGKAQTPQGPNKGIFHTATLASIYDGDTFKVNLQCTEAVLCHNVPVRVKGTDTPELKTKDACEHRAAQQAKAFTTSFLQGHKLDLRNCTRDKYFRLLCDVYSEGRSLASELIKRGLAYPYNGGTKAKINYCK